MKNFFGVLKKCPLFDGIEEAELERMLVCMGAKIELFDKKYTIFAEGTPAKYLGVVLSGSANIVMIDYDGNRSLIGTVHPSEVFAEAFACAGGMNLPVSVVANEPCEVMYINCDHILHTCENNCGFHRQLIYNVMKDLARKTITFHRKLEIISKRTTREKIMAYLYMRAKETGSRSFDIPYDRQELADYLEVDRSGLSAEISKLRQDGVIESERKHFVIL